MSERDEEGALNTGQIFLESCESLDPDGPFEGFNGHVDALLSAAQWTAAGE